MKRCLAALVFSAVILTGCAGEQRLAVHSWFAECHRPELADLPPLDEARHIGDAVNVALILLANDVQGRELEEFSGALDCYETQARKGGDSRPRSGASEALPRAARLRKGGTDDR